MTALLPQRIGCEVYLNDKIDATELIKYLEKKNEGRTDRKMTIFHCAITALARMLMERPTMNHFIQGWAIYERNEISLSFVARRTFVDGSACPRARYFTSTTYIMFVVWPTPTTLLVTGSPAVMNFGLIPQKSR